MSSHKDWAAGAKGWRVMRSIYAGLAARWHQPLRVRPRRRQNPAGTGAPAGQAGVREKVRSADRRRLIHEKFVQLPVRDSSADGGRRRRLSDFLPGFFRMHFRRGNRRRGHRQRPGRAQGNDCRSIRRRAFRCLRPMAAAWPQASLSPVCPR